MKLNRRQFLILGTASTGAVFASRWALSQRSAPSGSAIALPPLYKSRDGLLELDLEASLRSVPLANRQASLMSYNGQVPGPRLEAKPGDTVRIHFTNNLEQPTNLHYHGLHVSPVGNADNALLSIPAGERLTYEFTLPQNHPAGTFWYHPHHHEHVAEQVFGGLAGLLIVRGELDAIPEIQAAQEEFLVLQDFDLDANGRINPPNQMALMMGREGSLITVNGQVNPSLSIAKNGLLRLRLLNASPSRFYRLSLENHPLYLIATDGGAISQPVELSELLLAPGERAEVLVKGDQDSGTYRLLNLPYDRGGMGMMGEMGDNMMHGGMNGMMQHGREMQSQSTQTLATLSYQGSATPLALPETLIPVEPLPEPTTVRRLELSMEMGMGMNMAFTFNGKTFNSERVDIQPQLGTVEEWELANIDPDRMDHPFHLHINSFQVISRNGQPEPYLAWKDTVLIRGGETVRIRVPFRDFVGKTVYHCHILDHEDLGMMGLVEMKA
ncbi:MAG: multicopper oxidase family protein [Cyanobacteria bacterium CRU_2_1]|nr:multicopper oxidase family protein [Cyanobacteria bacterium CRU_2_1]